MDGRTDGRIMTNGDEQKNSTKEEWEQQITGSMKG